MKINNRPLFIKEFQYSETSKLLSVVITHVTDEVEED